MVNRTFKHATGFSDNGLFVEQDYDANKTRVWMKNGEWRLTDMISQDFIDNCVKDGDWVEATNVEFYRTMRPIWEVNGFPDDKTGLIGHFPFPAPSGVPYEMKTVGDVW